MPKIIGILPMAGSGERLGMPFPKPLTPVLDCGKIIPVYRIALRNLRTITTDVHGLIRPEDECFFKNVTDIKFHTVESSSAADTIRQAGLMGIQADVVAMALPDTVWTSAFNAFVDALGVHYLYDADITLLLTRHDEIDLDKRTMDTVSGRMDVRTVVVYDKKELKLGDNGWFAFLASPEFLSTWNSKESWATNINTANSIAVSHSGVSVFDIGTPEMYKKLWKTRLC